MLTVTDSKELMHLEDGNKFIGVLPNLLNSSVVFRGKNNILFCDENVTLSGSKIIFNGDNGVVFLSSNRNSYLINISTNNDSAVYFGRDSYFNGTFNVILSEQKHFFAGDSCLFSFGIWCRTADPHLVYDAKTGIRKNLSKSIFIGDHVWVGQSAMVLKGTRIHSGSIVGAMSCVPGKLINSCESWAGNPCKKVADGIFWTSDCVHGYRENETAKSMKHKTDEFVFSYDSKEYLPFEDIDEKLSQAKSAEFRFDALKTLQENRAKNRFSMTEEIKKKGWNILKKK